MQQTAQIYSYDLGDLTKTVVKKGVCRVGDTVLWENNMVAGLRSHHLHVLMEGHQLLTPQFPYYKTGSIYLAYSDIRECMRGITM